MKNNKLRKILYPILVVIVIFGLAGPMAMPALAADTGWVNPTANAADSGNGFETNPTRAYADGAPGYAYNSNGNGQSHRYYNYNLSIPAGDAITGIEVRLDWFLDSTSGTSSMSTQLSWNGGTSWTTTRTDSTETTSEHTAILGGPADTWGHAWTVNELNNTNFRVRVICTSSSGSRDFSLDWVPVRVYYCTPPDCTITAPSSVYRNSTGNTASVPDAGGGATYAWTITNGTITAGQGTRSITWSAGTVSPVTIGVTVTVAGCSCINSVQVTVTTPPALSVSVSGNLTFCEDGSTTLTANAAGGAPPYTYDWTDSTAPGTYTGNEYTATGAGTVAVTVTDSTMCSTTIVSDNNTMVTQGNVPGATYPHNAVLAYVHPSWWGGLTGYNFGYPSNTAQWIWESYYVVHPVEGDRVFFERTFNLPTLPTNATLHITCDNGYEVYMNGFFVGSAQVRPCWLTDNLTDTCVDAGGWQSVETYSVTLQKGSNTLEIKAANEYMESGSATPESNPGGVVYDLIYQYSCAVSDSVEVSVNPRPIASASSNSPVEEGSTILLTGGPDGMNSYSWTGPDGFSSFEQSPSIPNATIAMTGEYALTVTNSYSCSDNVSVDVIINPASIPTVTALEIYEDPGCTVIANSMTPQFTYYARLSVTLSNNLEHLQTVQVTLFYNSSGSDNMTAPTSGDTQTCAILACTVGLSPTWSISSGAPTSWTIETDECVQPPLNATSGAWIFAFKPGKVATENTGVADWDAQGKAIRNPTQTGELYVRNKDMNWYGEITVNTASVDWGEVPLALTSDNTTYNPKIVSIHYIANGDYYEDITSEDWSSGGETVTLDETGVDPPALPGMFALKADDTSILGSAITVTNSTYNHTNDTGGLTTEDGVTVNTNSLWLSLSTSGILPGIYSGDVHYQIAER